MQELVILTVCLCIWTDSRQNDCAIGIVVLHHEQYTEMKGIMVLPHEHNTEKLETVVLHPEH
jgi:hypothetical protein